MVKLLKRLRHELLGHPKEEVHWGSLAEGATCQCGARRNLDNYYFC
jgi:hypothetical protein